MWEMVQTREWKYVRWRSLRLDNAPAREELYHLPTDPREQCNRAEDPAVAQSIAHLRDTATRIMLNTPTGQIRWAPILADRSEPSDCSGIAPFFPRSQNPLPRDP
jgi:arylsulfatase A-like enzyme